MADYRVKWAVKTLVFYLLSIISLLLQLQCLVFLLEIKRKRDHDTAIAVFLAKRSYILRKLKKEKLRRLCRKKRSCWVKPGRTEAWWHNHVSDVVSEESWNKNFRMSQAAFYELVNELSTFIACNKSSPNYRAIPTAKKVAIALYYLKDTGSLTMTANAFGLHICTVSKVINEVCQAITYKLGPKYLHLPRDEDQMRRKVAEIEAKYGMPQAFGLIDGTHIRIKRPTMNSQDYFSYKGYFSFNVQAVCDCNGIFMDVDCRWPGSVHDAKVFANSRINLDLKNNSLSCFSRPLSQYGKRIGNYLIGDPGYPLTHFCMREYEHCQTNEEVVFNNLLRSARNPIECAFGRLKARWAVLTKAIDLKLDDTPTLIYACFVLHNFCELGSHYVDEDAVRSQIEFNRYQHNLPTNNQSSVYSCETAEGGSVRQEITEYIRKQLHNQS